MSASPVSRTAAAFTVAVAMLAGGLISTASQATASQATASQAAEEQAAEEQAAEEQARRGCVKVGAKSLYADGVRAATVNDYDCGATEYAQLWVWTSFKKSRTATWSADVYVERKDGVRFNSVNFSNVRHQDMRSHNRAVTPPSRGCADFSYGGRTVTACTPFV
ncbi:hypothetical protein AB0I81_33070 [Nonomuraea sp. NPDC050404]|uniref:hypothetical protein n=1 Tax=Nonomuraea sp. NPDC050404 TaxID=3155783 RepID=UPI00340D9565